MNIFKFLVIAIALVSFSTCTIVKQLFIGSKTVKEIGESRKTTMEEGAYIEETIELFLLRKNNIRILKKLAERLEKEGVSLVKNGTIFLVDTVEPNSIGNHHAGLLWNSDFYIRYKYDLKKKEIYFFEIEKDFNKYPRKQAYIPFTLMKFLETVEQESDFKNVPITGSTGSGHCVFSRIVKGKPNIVQSYAFWQY